MSRCAVVMLVGCLIGCDDGPTARPLTTRADSAGIAIVTSTGPSWRLGEGWRVTPEPLVQIGHRADGNPAHDLLQVTSGRLLPDGSLVVVVGGHRQLRIFGPDGEWVRSIGRDGDGPGEMRTPITLIVTGDTLYLTDLRLSRVSAFTMDGKFLTSWPMPIAGSAGRISPSFRLADGRWLGRTLVAVSSETPAGITRSPIIWYRIAADLSEVEGTVATLLGSERLVVHMTGAAGELLGFGTMPPVLGRTSVATVGPAMLFAGDSDHPEIRTYDAEGAVTTIMRWDAPIQPVNAALLDQMRQTQLGEAGSDVEMAEAIAMRFRSPAPTEAVPYFSGLHRDNQGNLWVQEYSLAATDSVRFTVLRGDGQWLGTLALPPKNTVLDIASDRILVVWRDEDELEYLRVYGIRKE